MISLSVAVAISPWAFQLPPPPPTSKKMIYYYYWSTHNLNRYFLVVVLKGEQQHLKGMKTQNMVGNKKH